MQEVCSVDDLGEGEVEGFEVEDTKILIARVDGGFYSLDDVCTHAQCSLSDGWLEDRSVVCPCHSAKFDLETGEVKRSPADEPEPVHKVTVEGDRVMVELSDG
ncbi:MAG: non-heme iron oxygenase ferredoxin subunit [Candidatus Nanohaloarchaeota archaeon QJJ-7]|nr:non-heme iron oxygenase ferredoxin subunit [Candidatus Nanohaloarchaeota archaeon QJJ-7]